MSVVNTGAWVKEGFGLEGRSGVRGVVEYGGKSLEGLGLEKGRDLWLC